MEIKKQKAQKLCHKNNVNRLKIFLEVTQLENKINQLEKNKVDVDSLRENHTEFIKNNKLILKSQQKFRSEKHNVFTEKVNKTALSANDDKRIQSIDSTEYIHMEQAKDLVTEKEEIKCNNIIKEYKNN